MMAIPFNIVVVLDHESSPTVMAKYVSAKRIPYKNLNTMWPFHNFPNPIKNRRVEMILLYMVNGV